MRRYSKRLTSLGSLLGNTAKKYGFSGSMEAANAAEIGQEFLIEEFDEALMGYITEVKAKRGVLVVVCSSPSAAAQIKLIAPNMIKYTNEKLQKDYVESVQTRVA